MNWADIPWAKNFKEDVPAFHFLSIEAQGLLKLLERCVERTGVLELGDYGLDALAVLLRHPHRAEDIGRWVAELVKTGFVSVSPRLLLLPYYQEQQATVASGKQRAKRKREKIAALARLECDEEAQRLLLKGSKTVTKRDGASRNVTSRHETGLGRHASIFETLAPAEKTTDAEASGVTKRDASSRAVTPRHETDSKRHGESRGVTNRKDEVFSSADAAPSAVATERKRGFRPVVVGRTDGRQSPPAKNESSMSSAEKTVRPSVPTALSAELEGRWAALVAIAREYAGAPWHVRPGKRPRDFETLLPRAQGGATFERVVAAYRRACGEVGKMALGNKTIDNFLRTASWRIEDEPEPEPPPTCRDCDKPGTYREAPVDEALCDEHAAAATAHSGAVH